jgi:molybdopterin-guanine dinucleotide biosynthesis protein A
MPEITPPCCSILLLAGGRGQRVGGADKGLLQWQGKPLIAWLHAQTRALTDDLIISCNRNQKVYAAYADQLVNDGADDFPGPLAGILAGLSAAHRSHLLVLPCDAPLLDQALLQRLLRAAGERPALLCQGGQWQPLFSLWPKTLLQPLQDAWQAGERSPQHFLHSQNALPLDCHSDDPRLANLNTPQLLQSCKAPDASAH